MRQPSDLVFPASPSRRAQGRRAEPAKVPTRRRKESRSVIRDPVRAPRADPETTELAIAFDVGTETGCRPRAGLIDCARRATSPEARSPERSAMSRPRADDPLVSRRPGVRVHAVRRLLHGAPGYVWVDAEEIARLAEFRGETVDAVLAAVRPAGRRSLQPDREARGRLHLLGQQAGCTVYPARPVQCRTWPFWPENIETPEDWEHVTRGLPRLGRGPVVQPRGDPGVRRRWSTHDPPDDDPPGPTRPLDRDSRGPAAPCTRELDAAVARLGPVCELSGRCCRFAEYDHTLFLSAPEAACSCADAPPPSRPLDDGATCPWQDARAAAPHGRPGRWAAASISATPPIEPTRRALTEAFLARLKRLVDDTGLPWNYAPLHHHLRQARGRGTVPWPRRPPEAGRRRVGRGRSARSPSDPGS